MIYVVELWARYYWFDGMISIQWSTFFQNDIFISISNMFIYIWYELYESSVEYHNI